LSIIDYKEEVNRDILGRNDNVELRNYRIFHKVTKCMFFAKPFANFFAKPNEKVIFAGFIQTPIYALPNFIPPI